MPKIAPSQFMCQWNKEACCVKRFTFNSYLHIIRVGKLLIHLLRAYFANPRSFFCRFLAKREITTRKVEW